MAFNYRSHRGVGAEQLAQAAKKEEAVAASSTPAPGSTPAAADKPGPSSPSASPRAASTPETVSGIGLVAQAIDKLGTDVEDALCRHARLTKEVDGLLMDLVSKVDKPHAVYAIARSVLQVRELDDDVKRVMSQVLAEADGPRANYSNVTVLMYVSKAQSMLANNNAVILGWLSTLGPSTA